MKEFVKPKTENVSDHDYIQNLVNVNLQKDLHDDEEICEYCHGTGLVVIDNSYGLPNDPDKRIGRFPYKHQSILFCPHCYNGVVHRCRLCGEVMPRGILRHDCEKQQELDKLRINQQRIETMKNAPIAPKEVEESMQCFYSEDVDSNDGYFFEWEDFFEVWECENEDCPNRVRPEFVWITESEEMHIDASNIVSMATEDLYEDAMDNISDKDINELQEYLNNWCANCGVGKTYYESHKYKVRIPWEKYNG